MKMKEKRVSKGKEEREDERKGKRNGKRKGKRRGREEEGEVRKDGEEERKRREEAGTTSRATMGPDRPTRAWLRGCPGLLTTAGRAA